MEWTNWMTGGALLGMVVACWNYIQGIAWKCASVLIQRIELSDYNLVQCVLGQLVLECKLSKVYDRSYWSVNTTIYSRDERFGLVPFEALGRKMLIFWKGWLPIIFLCQVQPAKPTNSSAWAIANPVASEIYVVLFLRGTLEIDQLISRGAIRQNERFWRHELANVDNSRRFFIWHIPEFDASLVKGQARSNGLPWFLQPQNHVLAYTAKDLSPNRDKKQSALDLLIFPEHVLKPIEEIRRWRQSREWYRGRNIPWKRGWLLYGPPGTGKTALARACAEDLDMPIFVYSLSEMGNHAFQRSWTKMQTSAPCIALLEDFDTVFSGKENISKSRSSPWSMIMMSRQPSDNPVKQSSSEDDGENLMAGGVLSFDTFINMLDGVNRNEGIFTIITTNNPASLDQALGIFENGQLIATRPGRIDKAIELTYMTLDCKERLARRILGEFPEALKTLIRCIQMENAQETPAQFQERCAQLALHCYWQTGQQRDVIPPAQSDPGLYHAPQENRNGHSCETQVAVPSGRWHPQEGQEVAQNQRE